MVNLIECNEILWELNEIEDNVMADLIECNDR